MRSDSSYAFNGDVTIPALVTGFGRYPYRYKQLLLECGASPRCSMGRWYPDCFSAIIQENRVDLIELVLRHGPENVRTNTRQTYSNSGPDFNTELFYKDLKRAMKWNEASQEMEALFGAHIEM